MLTTSLFTLAHSFAVHSSYSHSGPSVAPGAVSVSPGLRHLPAQAMTEAKMHFEFALAPGSEAP